MRFKSTWIVIAIFAGLSAYFYFVENPKYQEKQEQEKKAGLLFPQFDSDKVTALEIQGKKGTVRVVKGEGDKWSLTVPSEDRADDGGVRSLLNDLKAVKGKKEIAKADADLKPFGLAEPEAVVETTGQKAKLAIGGLNPAGDYRYVRANDGPVRAAMNASVSGFLKGPDDLRNKYVVDESFPWGDLTAVEVRPAGDGTPLSLAKKDGNWRIEAPVNVEADPDAVERLTDKLRWARVSGFLDKDPKTVNEALNKGISVVLHTSGKGEPVTVRMAEEDGKVWAERSGRNARFTLSKDVFGAFKVSVADLQRMRPLLTKAWQVKKLEVALDGQSLSYQKTKDGKWQRDGAALAAVEATALQDYLRALEESRADRVVSDPGAPAEYGLDSPTLKVSLEDGDGQKNLAVGRKGKDLYARSGDTGPVYQMPASYLEKASALLAATKPPEPVKAAPKTEGGKKTSRK